MMFVQPDTERGGRAVLTTTDQPISPIMPKPKPDALRGFTRLDLARRVRADLPAKVGSFFEGFFDSLIHVERSRSDAEIPFPIFVMTVRTLCSCSSRVRNSFFTASCNLAEVRSADRPAHGNEHVRAGFDQQLLRPPATKTSPPASVA